jgi:signal transduction histidine kinase
MSPRERFRNSLAPVAPALIVLVFGVLAYSTARREDVSVGLVERSHEIIEENQALLTRMVDAETGERGFSFTGDSLLLEPYLGAQADVERRLAAMRPLGADTLAWQARLDTLGGLVRRRFALFDSAIARRPRPGFSPGTAANAMAGVGKATMDSARVIIAEIENDERRMLAARNIDRAAHVRTVQFIVVAGSIVAAAFALFVGLLLSRYAASQSRLVRQLEARAHELESANQQLQDQAVELEAQAAELEALNDELQATNTQLEERTEEAEQANRVKARFLANTSHDLRTPLNAIIGYVELLELELRGPITEQQRGDLQRIKRSSTHLLSLIDEVLDFAKIAAGHTHVRIENVLLGPVLAGIDALVDPQVKAKRLAYSRVCDPELHVLADRAKLEQILVNLLGNAIKYTADGGRIWMECTVADRWVSVAVRDTGRGISEDELDVIFDPFVQGGPPSARGDGQQGVGLGLSISRELARAMNGDLTVVSGVGDGSTFTLRLPHRRSDTSI